LNSNEEQRDYDETTVVEPPATIANYYFLGNPTDSGNEYVERHVVKSKKDKCLDEMVSAVDQLNYAIDNDCGRLQESFDNVNKQLEKFMRVSVKVPKHYIRILVMLEDFLARVFP